MSPIRRSAVGVGAFAIVAILWIGSGVGWGAPSLPAGSARPVPSSTTSPPLVYHAALYVNNTPPTGSTPSGEIIGALYRVTAPTYPANAAPATVRIPSTLVSIPTNTGGVHLYFSALNLTLNGNSTAVGTAGPANRFGSPLLFNTTPAAVLTTQGIAVAASWPTGTYSLQFRWQWVLEAPDGSTDYGPWSSATSVTPAQIADLTFPGGLGWTIGASNSICVGGEVAGRTFSAHLSTNNPSAVVVTGTVTVPAGQTGPFCWANVVPAGIAPQDGFLHLWEYGNLTYELTVVLVPLVGTSGPGGAAPGAGGATIWLPAILLGCLALILVIGYAVMFVVSPQTLGRFVPRHLRSAPAGPEPPPGADPASTLSVSPAGTAQERTP